MKRVFALLLTALLVCSLAACGSKPADDGFTWTRTGSFVDEDDNYLLISPSEAAEYPGWSVTCLLGDEIHGWYIAREGRTLHGDLTAEGEEGHFIVTISEEDENGLQLVVKGGKTYHFKPTEDLPEAGITIRINCEGSGQIAYAEEGQEPKFNDDFPVQSAQLDLAEPATYVLEAKAGDEFRFIKWTKDGEDYSTSERITVEFTESAEFDAVFEYQAG